MSTPAPHTRIGAEAPILTVHAISKHYAGLRAVDDVSLEVRRGELLGLIGPNGAGKSTLFNCIAGATPPTAGQVMFKGESITGIGSRRIARRGLARTYQNLRVFPDMTVFDNVSAGAIGAVGTSLFDALLPAFRHDRAERIADETLKALEMFDLLQFADQPAGNLSYGQKKNLEMARAIALRPQLLMLDEPAAGLNTETAQLAERMMRLCEEGITIMLVEHDMPMVMKVCDRILVLEAGRLIADGTPAQIRQDPAVQTAYLGTEP